jgi:hypothetical protein
MIRARNIRPESPIRAQGRTVYIPYPAFSGTNVGYILASGTAASTMTVGTALTLLETTTRGMHSIAVTSGAAQTSAFSFTIIGENQFGESVTETVTTTGANAINHSLHCYRKIISITPTAKSSAGTDTVAIGWRGEVTSGTPRLALPFKPSSTSSIKYVSMLSAPGAMPTFTPELTRYTIAISANPLLNSTTGGTLILTLDEGDGNI